MKISCNLFTGLTLLIFSGVFQNTCSAQFYTLQVETGQAYQEITNPTYEIPDNSPYFGNITIKPDMYFSAFGQMHDLYDNVFIPIKQGYCYFDNGVRSATLYACEGKFTKRPGQTSVFPYKTDTTSGDRKLILQWKNMGFVNGHDTDYINFQVWLHEKNGLIEFRFGANKVRPGLYVDGANGPTIGLLDMDASFTTIFSQVWLKGQPAQPQVVNSGGIVNLDQTPANGTVYKFWPHTSALSETSSNAVIRIYPNPASEVLHLDIPPGSSAASACITNSTGQEIMNIHTAEKLQDIDVSSLFPGIYFIRLIDQNGTVSMHRFSKQ